MEKTSKRLNKEETCNFARKADGFKVDSSNLINANGG